MKFAMSYSFGKDSALALWRMMQQGHTPVCLIVTVNRDAGRSWFHGVTPELMDAVAESTGIPLLACLCSGDDYNAQMEKTLLKAKEMGAAACCFGDIDIDGHLEWNRARCGAAGLECMLPLWQHGRQDVVDALLDCGINPVIKCAQKEYRAFLGQTLTHEVAAALKTAGADICGENGEYHTFVHDGPFFQHPVPISLGTVAELGTHCAIELNLQHR